MKRFWLFALLLIAAPLLTTGCVGSLFGINLTAVGEKTALERQVLGTYEQIGRDLSVYASVRGVDPSGALKEPPASTDSQRATMLALNNRRYNRDDLELLLTAGAVGEGNDGLLSIRNDAAVTASTIGEELARQVIVEENRDRVTILSRLQETTPGVTEANRADVAWVFATLNHDLAPAGASIQRRDGTWVTK
ncbi:DUF1318 domain-containing protein [bacterium]|nr:DUF1318 domain-containing protein [bacterium]